MHQNLFILGVAGFLAACGGGPPSDPPANQAAYDQGCRAGLLDGGASNNYVSHRDDQLYAADDDYRRSWDAGYGPCFDRALSNPRKR